MNRQQLVELAKRKPTPPYTLDEELTFFCPQENLEGLELPVVQRFLAWAREEYEPPRGDERAVLLMLPCQKTKPYPLSSEHVAINSRLLAEGFEPTGRGDYPDELDGRLEPELLSNAPLVGHGLRIDRAAISEPFGFVPYEAIYHWQGELTPCARYDDPGLFEHRGIDPIWRGDCTASGGRWGDNERAAYVEVHNRMAEQLQAVGSRLRDCYVGIVGYVAPSLTHRSFLADDMERRRSAIPRARKVSASRHKLIGVNDLTPGLVEIVPDGDELRTLRDRHQGRLPTNLLERGGCLDLLINRLRSIVAKVEK